MPNDLALTRLRALIAAATPGELRKFPLSTPWTFLNWSGTAGRFSQADADLILALVNNTPALADALAKVKIYEEALIAIDQGRGGCEETHCWNVAEQALIRAAKEAHDGNI